MAISFRSLYPWALGFLAAVDTIVGFAMWVQSDSGPEIEVLLPTPTPPPELKVYLSGAISQPGVYLLQEGDRLGDALIAAGGPLPEADLAVVNLALRIRDEDHFNIPLAGEEPPDAPQPVTDLSTTPEGRININLAGVDLLEEPPNIGEVRAQAIVDYRQRNGTFGAPEEIMEVNGIGLGVFESIRELISVR